VPDLREIPVVDQHCHALVPLPDGDVTAWRACFTESREPDVPDRDVPQTLFYGRLLGRLATMLACPPGEAAVLAARKARPGLLADLVADAKLEALIFDRGFPEGEVLPDDAWRDAGAATASLLRLEPLMERLVRAHETLAHVQEAMVAALAGVREQGFVGLKSIAAYRSGLHVRPWTTEDVATALAAARRRAALGPYRIAEKPLLDHLLLLALEQAARQELPVQFHVGYGDVDADLRLANPLHLRWVLEQRRFRGIQVVLLHSCYPYTREGAYLAAVYSRVHLDLSFGIPFLGLSELEMCTRAALAVAPASKLLYSSDGVRVPELHWMSAGDARQVLGKVLDESVARAELRPAEALAMGEAILRNNARRLYNL
jgi:predicted TIM-barrel fold metal-dependent hydrolase